MVCRCYERSLLLDPSQSTLWIERGTFSYTIHSFCSNLLKKLWYSCSGKDIQDERWLHHYMLGKIAEKKEEDPQIFVEHYTKASELLHEIGATYPFHICYSAPQPLAVETLELYYRVHACILKSLEDNEDKPLPGQTIKVFKEAINRFGKSSFVTKVSDCVR
ncbi:hypothetical protein AAG570_010108 [Ranatra chinensis]|uniref:Uncharacterized protein n=1 Tax=Ranatra chinensis TaxID=642074 RepID=A0ABD0YLK1_9HEMI